MNILLVSFSKLLPRVNISPAKRRLMVMKRGGFFTMKRAGRFLAGLAVLAFTAASPVLAEEAPAEDAAAERLTAAGAAAEERLTAADAAAADAAAAEVAEAEAGRGKRATGRRVRGAGR
jgi:hypothetical protein